MSRWVVEAPSVINLAKLKNCDCVSQDLFRPRRRSRTPVGRSPSLIDAKLSLVFQVRVVVPSEKFMILVGVVEITFRLRQNSR